MQLTHCAVFLRDDGLVTRGPAQHLPIMSAGACRLLLDVLHRGGCRSPDANCVTDLV